MIAPSSVLPQHKGARLCFVWFDRQQHDTHNSSAPLERLDAEVERHERDADQESHYDARKLGLVANQQYPAYDVG
jgi:hypothetical protein